MSSSFVLCFFLVFKMNIYYNLKKKMPKEKLKKQTLEEMLFVNIA
jgi:hypothetical protein